MTEFIGLEKEPSALQSLYDKDGFQMVAIYGRRRVEKTTLVNKFFEKNKCKSVSFVSTEMSEAELLSRMGEDVLESLALALSGCSSREVPLFLMSRLRP